METFEHKNLSGVRLAQWLKDNIAGQEITSIAPATSEQKESLEYPGDNVQVITLANGYQVIVDVNEGCGGCLNGWAEFDIEQDGAGVVTGVGFEDLTNDYSDRFKLFIYLENQPAIRISGDDGVGNGFYGYGFYVTVKHIEMGERTNA